MSQINILLWKNCSILFRRCQYARKYSKIISLTALNYEIEN